MDELEEIYQHHFGAVFRFAIHCVGRRELAEDLTSEAFWELYRNWAKIDPSQLPGWLIAAVKNRAIDYWRRASREEFYAHPPAEAHAEFDLQLESFLEENKALKSIGASVTSFAGMRYGGVWASGNGEWSSSSAIQPSPSQIRTCGFPAYGSS